MAAAQDKTAAIEMSEQCARNWNRIDSVRCGFVVTTELPGGRTVGAGDCLFVGGRARVSMVEETMGFRLVMVKGDRYVWIEMRPSEDPPLVEVIRYFRGNYDYERETLIGMTASSPILHHPPRIFDIVARNYDLSFGSKLTETENLLIALEGELEPDRRREDLGQRLSAEQRKILERMTRCRITIRAEDFFPRRVEFFRDEGNEPELSVEFTGYRLNAGYEESEFEYTPPAGVPVNDLAAKRREQFRFSPRERIPPLPLVDRASFHALSDETRVDVLLLGDGSFKIGKKRCHDFDGVYRSLWWAATFFGRNRTPGALPLADVDVVVHAAPDSDIDPMATLLQAGSLGEVCINRFHLAVQDTESGQKGYVPVFLPADVGLRPGAERAAAPRSEPFEVTLGGGRSGPEYRVTQRSNNETGSFDSLDDLAACLEDIRKRDRSAGIVCAIGIRQRGGDPSGRRPFTIEHLVNFLDLLASHGADLTRERLVEKAIIEQTDPSSGK